MVSVLEKLRGLFSKNGDDLDFAGIRARADLEAGVASAKRAGADTWDPPALSLEEKLACLERWYFHVRQKSPDLVLSGEEMRKLEPAGLTDREMRDWYWGLRGEAARRVLQIVNTSYSKSAVREAMRKEGLENALMLFDPGTRESYEWVFKYLSN